MRSYTIARAALMPSSMSPASRSCRDACALLAHTPAKQSAFSPILTDHRLPTLSRTCPRSSSTLPHPLVADRARHVDALVDVASFEKLPRRLRLVGPHPGETIRLHFGPDLQAISDLLAYPPAQFLDLVWSARICVRSPR